MRYPGISTLLECEIFNHTETYQFVKSLILSKYYTEQIVEWFENFDLERICTPVDAEKFRNLLIQAEYDVEKINYLYQGFSKGFSLKYEGLQKVRKFAPNLKLRVGNKFEIWSKMMKEVKEKRFAGPFKDPPFEHFIQPPIGLVPKDGGRKTRLIFHLSYPRNGNKESVNANIPEDSCTVKYPDFAEAIKMCIRAGKNCRIRKSDISMAFRNVPMDPQS